MAHRILNNLLKIRQGYVNEAAAALADALAREDVAIAVEISATNAILAELSAASAASTDNADLEALSAWLLHARKCQHTLRCEREAAEAAAGPVRAGLAAARTAEATVLGMIEKRRNVENEARRKATQEWLLEQILGRVGCIDQNRTAYAPDDAACPRDFGPSIT